jgi:hypothetical protein
MGSLWSSLSTPKNQKTLSWLAPVLVAILGALGTAYLHFFSPTGDGGSIKVEASCGSTAVQGNMIGSSITTSGASSTGPCEKARTLDER